MKLGSFACVLAMGAVLLPQAARADDPRDPAMRDAEAHARDHAITRGMNQRQLDYVRQRDQRVSRAARSDRDAYADARAEYARKMAAWRHAVAACEAGHWEYCDN